MLIGIGLLIVMVIVGFFVSGRFRTPLGFLAGLVMMLAALVVGIAWLYVAGIVVALAAIGYSFVNPKHENPLSRKGLR